MKKIFLLVVFLFFYSCRAQAIPLFSNGKSQYTIIQPSTPTQTERDAVKLFQSYFKQATGLKLPVRDDKSPVIKTEIVIGNTSRTENFVANLAEDAVAIKTEGNKVFLSGGSRKGVLYAVTAFLEDYLGVRYFASDCIVVPHKTVVEIPQKINYIYSTPFSYRSQHNLESEQKNYADFHRLNYFFENRLYFAHSFAWLIPADKYFKTHPEYFALINGKRDSSQMCFSSEGLLNELIKVLRIEMSLSPANKVWSVSTLDSPNYCHCSYCEKKYKSGSGFSEALIPFVNRVAKEFPDKTISTLAYNQSILPAVNSAPAPNVEIMFCFTDVDRSKPIESLENEEAKKFRDALQAWKKQTTNLFVWDYTVNYFHSLSPFPNIYTLKPNLQYFQKQGFKKVFEQGIGPQKGEFSELKAYLLAKLLWNPALDDRKIIKEFCDAYYGPASAKIQQYIDTLNQTGTVNHFLGVYNSPEDYKSDFLTEAKINQYENLLDSALVLVPQNSVYYPRIKKELLTIKYAQLVNNKPLVSNFSKGDFNSVSVFATEADQLGIKFLRNGEYAPQMFLQDYLKPK